MYCTGVARCWYPEWQNFPIYLSVTLLKEQPHSQAMSPHFQAMSPHSQGVSPHSQGVSPHSQAMSPHSQAMSPHSQTMSPHSQGVMKATSLGSQGCKVEPS